MAEFTSLNREREAELLLGHLFPDLCNEKINTLKFLQASRGIVTLIVYPQLGGGQLALLFSLKMQLIIHLNADKFGTVFSPLSFDISGNINKIQKCYETNPNKYTFIEDLILSEKMENGVAVDALLWLQRALHFVLIFFMQIVKDTEKNESLQEHMMFAYTETLKPYHGWFTRNLFRFFRGLAPQRSALLSAIAEDKKDCEEVIRDLEIYLSSLETNVKHIIDFYKERELSLESKVP